MDFNKIKKNSNFDWNKVIAFPDGGISLDFEFEIEPEDFLDYAELDLQKNDNHSLVNALSNSKRAIDCSAEKIIKIFNLKPRTNNFPSKLELLQEIGVVAPRIINKVNKNRNFLEHKFKVPSKENVEDALDIANLFVSAVNGVLRSVWTDFYIKEGPGDLDDGRLENAIYFSFDDKKKEWKATLYKNDKKFHSIVTPELPAYKSIIKLTLSGERNVKKEKEAIKELSDNAN